MSILLGNDPNLIMAIGDAERRVITSKEEVARVVLNTISIQSL